MSPTTLQHEIGKRKPFDSAEQEAYLNLLRTASVLGVRIGRMFKRHGLSEATYNILRILRGEMEHGSRGVPCQLIGERLIAQVPDTTRLLDRLESAGLVKRSRTTEDRRVVLISITSRGQELLAQLDAPLMDLHREQLGHMSRAELTDLSRLLVKARHPEENA
jgi:DNA-binding MarR family transcriptional regulator